MHGVSRHRLAAITFGAGASLLAACQSGTTGSGTIPSSLDVLSKGAPRVAPTYSFQPYSVGYNTQITGINTDTKGVAPPIVGVSYGADSTKYASFIAFKTSASSPQYGNPAPYPPATPPGLSLYISAVNNIARQNTYGAAGFSPPYSGSYGGGCGYANKYCGFIFDPQLSPKQYQVRDPHVGSGSCAATYLYGTDGSAIQVGYYTDVSCNAHAIEEYKYPNLSPQFIEFQLPSSLGCGNQSWAYGISHYDDVVGSCTVGSSKSKLMGWKYSDFNYLPIKFPGATSTQALGINAGGQVVGTYKQCSSSCTVHGFVTKKNDTTFYTVDFTTSTKAYPTVVNAISTLQTIVGWYYNGTTANSVTGFIGTCNFTTTERCAENNNADLRKQ